MATKKITVSDGDADDVVFVRPDESFDDLLAGVVSELGESGGGTVKVERVRDGKRLEYVDEFDAAAFSLKALQQQFGGGEYRVTVKNSKGRYVKSGNVAIAQPRQVSAPAATAPDGLDRLASAISKQGEVLAMLLLRQQQPAAPAQDQSAARNQLLQDMVLMKQLLGGQQLGPERIIELMKTGMELARESNSDGGIDWSRALEKGIEVFGTPLAAMLESRPAPRASPALARSPATAMPAAVQRPPQQEVKPVLSGISKWIGFLVERAASNSPPELYAELIVDNVPDAIVRQYLGGGPDQAVERLAELDGRVREHLDWFKRLGSAVAEFEDDAADPAGPSAGDGATGGDS